MCAHGGCVCVLMLSGEGCRAKTGPLEKAFSPETVAEVLSFWLAPHILDPSLRACPPQFLTCQLQLGEPIPYNASLWLHISRVPFLWRENCDQYW